MDNANTYMTLSSCVLFFFFFSGQLPNVVGLTFGVIQIGLYAMYRNNKPIKDQKLPEHKGDIVESENVIAPTGNGEKQEEEVKPQGGDIEIGEKKELYAFRPNYHPLKIFDRINHTPNIL